MQEAVVDCSQPGEVAQLVALTADELTAYNAMQPIGAQQSAAYAASQALTQQHVAALAAIKEALTANAAGITSDLAALQTIATALQAGTQLTAAQVTIILRTIVRVLVVTNA